MLDFYQEILSATSIIGFFMMGTNYISEVNILSDVKDKKDQEILKEIIRELFFVYYTKVQRKAMSY
jgi:hypothetical protein